MSILLETSLGDLVFDLHTDLCPKASKNFIKLCKSKYYNNCIFHSGLSEDFHNAASHASISAAGN